MGWKGLMPHVNLDLLQTASSLIFMHFWVLGIKRIYFGIHTAVVTVACINVPELSWITAMWQHRAQGRLHTI